MIIIKKIKDLNVINKNKLLQAGTLKFNFYSWLWNNTELIVYYQKWISKYRAEIKDYKNKIWKATEAWSKVEFIKRIHSIIKTYFKWFQKNNQISLNLFIKDKYEIIWDKKLAWIFLINYSSYVIKEVIKKLNNKYWIEVYKTKKSYEKNKIKYTLKSINEYPINNIKEKINELNFSKIWNKFYFIQKNVNYSMGNTKIINTEIELNMKDIKISFNWI